MNTTTNELFEFQDMVEPLVKWYNKNKRSMVWRDCPTPYFVWISEIMLQQTRIEAAKSYFVRFTKELPDIQSLASVDEERLLKLWQGLGYYNRARNLQKTAKLLVERYEGNMPAEYDILLTLPGIGPYTAGAISSIAFQKKAAAVDGNVLRVTMRYAACKEEITNAALRKRVEKSLIEVMPTRPGDFNQALMELGETICIPNGKPLCEKCPIHNTCTAHQKGCEESFPVKPEKKMRRIEEKTILLIQYEQNYAIQKRPDKGLLSGLWEFPNEEGMMTERQLKNMLERYDISYRSIKRVSKAKHIFSHVEWNMTGYHVVVNSKEHVQEWNHHLIFTDAIDLLENYSIPVAYHTYLEEITRD